MLTPEQQNNIRKEAEKKYPDSNFEWVNRVIEARRDTYIDTATLYQERINGLVEALGDIDFTLTMMEDYIHGSDGVKITQMRRQIQEALDTYNKTITP